MQMSEGSLLQDDAEYAKKALAAANASADAAKERRDHGKDTALKNREAKLNALKKADVVLGGGKKKDDDDSSVS